MEIYLVGGAVRDNLLGLPTHERDWVVVGATAEDLLGLGYKPVGKDFPVFLHPETKDEYALARTERKQGRGYKGFEVFASPEVTLEDDLIRRDLTINAMARSAEGELIDPYKGQQDLEDRILRHISPSFIEDPLRVLRVARFAAKLSPFGFKIAPETRDLMRSMSESGELSELVPERVWQEFEKSLSTDHPQVFFRVLHETAALKVIVPELDRLFGVPQPENYHPEIDTGVHTLMVIEQAAKLSPKLAIRWAALLHDLGKGSTPENQWPSHHGHEKRSVSLATTVCDRLRVPKSAKELALLVAAHHGKVHRAFELRADTVLNLLNSIDAWRRPERVADFLLACEADSRGRTGYESREYPQAHFLASAADACRKVDAGIYVKQGLSGSDISKALDKERQQLIAELKKKFSV